jgi:hypothetical protein
MSHTIEMRISTGAEDNSGKHLPRREALHFGRQIDIIALQTLLNTNMTNINQQGVIPAIKATETEFQTLMGTQCSSASVVLQMLL